MRAAGHTGLTMVSEDNRVGGAHFGRSLWHFRARVYGRFKLPRLPPQLPPGGGVMRGGARPRVLFVETKRPFNNFEAVQWAVGNSTMSASPSALHALPSFRTVSWTRIELADLLPHSLASF